MENKKRSQEEEIIQVIIGISFLALVTMKLISSDVNRRPIINNFYIIDDKIRPIRYR